LRLFDLFSKKFIASGATSCHVMPEATTYDTNSRLKREVDPAKPRSLIAIVASGIIQCVEIPHKRKGNGQTNVEQKIPTALLSLAAASVARFGSWSESTRSGSCIY
jgi:hypothetical protein